MQPHFYILKLKKVGTYFFVAVGVLSILWFVLQVFLSGARVMPDGGYGGGQTLLAPAPVAIPNPLRRAQEIISSNFFSTEKIISQPQRQEEGILTQRKVIKNASLSLLVKEVEETAQSIKNIADSLEGFIASSQVYEVSEGVKSGTITIRVPADRFDKALIEVKKLAVKVEREDISASDVTEQFVDLEAQLRNLRAEEEQYLKIMDKATTVEDTLSVAQRLYDVRRRIEHIQGQLQYLAHQVDMSTITVHLISEADIEVFGIRWRPLFVVKQAFRSMLEGLTRYVDAIIRFVFALPVILLWLITIGLVVIAGWKVLRWIRRKFFLQ